MLTLVPQGGLCNRLRILLSAIQAKAQGVQPIRVEWGRDPECSAWFEELFVPVDMGGFRVVHRHWWAAPRTRRNLWLPVLLRLFMGYRVQRANYRPATDDDFFRLVRRGGRVYLSGGYALCHYSPDCVARLCPRPELMQRIERIKARFGRNTVGVHIRRTDNTVSMAHSTPEGFRRAMDREIKRDFNVRFFLATDDEALKSTLMQEYPDHIISQRAPLRRDTLEGMGAAVVDLWCLSATRKLIGSYWSSFTDTAAELTGIPLEVVRE